MQFYDAFCGIGGFHLGLTQADPGNICVGACEIDKFAREIYSEHFPEVRIDEDIRNVAELPEKTDLLCGGFPCQDVSIAGRRKGLRGEKTSLFYELVRLAKKSKPRYLFFENVAGLLTSNRGKDFAEILLALESVGYAVEWAVIDTADVLPQHRRRVYLVGHLDSPKERFSPVFPIRRLPAPPAPIQIPKVGTITAGYWQGRRLGSFITYGAVHHNKNTGAQHTAVETKEVRFLTPMECERLQGFPDDWTAGVSDSQRYRQLGNAVSVPVVRAIGQRLRKALLLSKEPIL